MGTRAEKAITNHKHFYPCSTAVLSAFSEDAGISESDAKKIAMPFAGGRMGKCGAVLAAEYVLEKKFGSDAEEKKRQFEQQFTEMNTTLMCKELKGSLTGKAVRSCRGCVTDAAELLEKMLEESN